MFWARLNQKTKRKIALKDRPQNPGVCGEALLHPRLLRNDHEGNRGRGGRDGGLPLPSLQIERESLRGSTQPEFVEADASRRVPRFAGARGILRGKRSKCRSTVVHVGGVIFRPARLFHAAVIT